MGKLLSYSRFLTLAGMKQMGQVNFDGNDTDNIFTTGLLSWRETDTASTTKYGFSLRGIDVTEDIKNIISNVYADSADYETEVFTLNNGAEVRFRGYYSAIGNSTTHCGGILTKLYDKNGNLIKTNSHEGFVFTNNDNNTWDNLIQAVYLFGTRETTYNPNYKYFGALLLKYKFSWESGNPLYNIIWLDQAGAACGFTETEWKNFIGDAVIDMDDPYGTDSNHTPPGGYGPHDYTSEEELPPGVPSVSAADVGFISLWNPTAAELKDLADWLWTGNFVINTWRAITASPMECILSVGIIPITPTRYQESGVDTKKEIKFVGAGTDVTSYKATEQYYVVDMGSVHINGMSKSNMDYAPYAKASIFLPYCGTYALDVDEIMDADVSLEYHIDIYTGACVAYLTISGKVNSDEHEVNAVMYQFTGNCLATIPVTSVDHSQFIQSLLFMGASVAATVATAGGGAGAAAAGADLGAEAGVSAGAVAATAGSAINTVMSMKPNVLHSGNLSSTAGFLGGQKPYITMTWSNLCRAEDEYKVVGMPLNRSGKLSDFAGLTVISGVHLDNIKCTDIERTMIEQALYKGVIVPEGGVT